MTRTRNCLNKSKIFWWVKIKKNDKIFSSSFWSIKRCPTLRDTTFTYRLSAKQISSELFVQFSFHACVNILLQWHFHTNFVIFYGNEKCKLASSLVTLWIAIDHEPWGIELNLVFHHPVNHSIYIFKCDSFTQAKRHANDTSRRLTLKIKRRLGDSKLKWLQVTVLG